MAVPLGIFEPRIRSEPNAVQRQAAERPVGGDERSDASNEDIFPTAKAAKSCPSVIASLLVPCEQYDSACDNN